MALVGRGHFFLLLVTADFIGISLSDSFSRSFQIEVRSEQIPVLSASMLNEFLDLTANLIVDKNEATCASSDWTRKRSLEFTVHQVTRIHAVSLLMHKYVDVDLEVSIRNSSGEAVMCNRLQKNTGMERVVNVVCSREISGQRIIIEDLRPTNEFFVVCEVSVFGAPGTLSLQNESQGIDLTGVYIGCGVSFLAIVTAIVIVVYCKGKSKSRRPSEAHSLNTLSMMTSRPTASEGSVMHRRPIPSPRPAVISRSVPNAYDRPMSVKDTLAIYETIPGDEPPYLVLVSEKELYDDASSVRK